MDHNKGYQNNRTNWDHRDALNLLDFIIQNIIANSPDKNKTLMGLYGLKCMRNKKRLIFCMCVLYT